MAKENLKKQSQIVRKNQSQGPQQKVSKQSLKKIKILSDVTIVPPTEQKPPNPVIPTCDPSISQHVQEFKPGLLDVSVSIILSPTKSTQTSLHLSHGSSRKKTLRLKIKRLQKMYKTKKSQAKDYGNYNLEEFNRFCDEFLDKLPSSIIKTHAALKTRAPLGRRYTNEIKQFALMFYFVSLKAYNLLSKLLTPPLRRTLQRTTENIYLRPGLNNKVIFEASEIKTKTMKMDKYFLLCIDEMSLKSNFFIGPNLMKL
nr:unnamed protein product [Callosobruchus analis]